MSTYIGQHRAPRRTLSFGQYIVRASLACGSLALVAGSTVAYALSPFSGVA